MIRFLITISILLLSFSTVKNYPDISVYNGIMFEEICPAIHRTFLGPVVVTMYHPVREQTNENPDIVADGTWFDISQASDLKWIAISRDLHSRWGGPISFNDIIYLKKPGKPGEYFLVKDLMNARFTMRVDILETPGTPIYFYDFANLYLLTPEGDTNPLDLWVNNFNKRIFF